jgi:hypothetical protein
MPSRSTTLCYPSVAFFDSPVLHLPLFRYTSLIDPSRSTSLHCQPMIIDQMHNRNSIDRSMSVKFLDLASGPHVVSVKNPVSYYLDLIGSGNSRYLYMCLRGINIASRMYPPQLTCNAFRSSSTTIRIENWRRDLIRFN